MNKIVCDDALNYLTEMDGDCVHLTCTSPPYYNAKAYAQWSTYDKYLQFLEDIFREVYRVTEQGRMCAVNLSPVIQARESRAHESKRLAIPFHFFSIMERLGWQYIDDIIWLKPEGSAVNRNGGFFQHRKPVAYKPNLVTETILIFKKPASFLIDKTVRSYAPEILERSLVPDGYERSNVWCFNPETTSKHLAPYPTELSDRIVQYYSFVNDLVLDPFMGSGTTAISCLKYDRRYIGVEIHEEYVKMADDRIARHTPLKKFL
tara:strand:+ start:54 stop:839 length:786 start_codon:yes stop_codon:yes gene_type:complete